MTEQEKLINVDLYGDGSRDSRLRAEYIYCDHADVCSVYKEGKCFRNVDHIRPMCKKLSLSDVQIAEADKDGRLVALPSDKALTNADRMRAATNQQLAKLLYDNQKEFCRLMYKNLGFEDELTFSEDYSDILAWLNAPAEMGVVQDKDE